MSELLRRIGPSSAVLGLVVWCCWPYLSTSRSSLTGTQESKLPRISRALLDPKIRQPSRRDPFQTASEDNGALASQRSALVPLEAMKGFFRKLQQDRQWLANRQAARRAGSISAGAPFTPSELGNSLRLQATCLYLDDRLAVINDRIYAEGDDVALPGSEKSSCTVQQVLSDGVILDLRGKTVNLTYPAALGSAKHHEPPQTATVPTSGGSLLEDAVRLLPTVPVQPTASGA